MMVFVGVECSYRPNVTVAYVASQLAFPTTDKCVEWLAALEGLLYAEEGAKSTTTAPSTTATLDCKNSAAAIVNL